MKYIIFVVLLFAAFCVKGQSVYPIRADTVKLYKVGGYTELVVQNRTKDSLGLMINVGNGRTEFRRPKTLDSTHIIIGMDTLVVAGGGGSGGTDSAIAKSYGIKINISGTTRYILVDTVLITSILSRKKLADSLGVITDGKMANFGGAPGCLIAAFTSRPAANTQLPGTQFIAPDSGRIYVDTGSGGTAGWKLISGGSSSVAQIQSDWNQSTTTAVDYIKNKPTLGTAAAKNIPASGDASVTEVVYGTDTRLSNSRAPNGTAGGSLSGSYPNPGIANNAVGTAQIANNAVTYAKIQAATVQSILGAPSAGNFQELTIGNFLNISGGALNVTPPDRIFRYNVVDFPGTDTTGNNPTANRRGWDSCIAWAQRSPYPAAVVAPSGTYGFDSSLIPITKALTIEGFNANLKSSNTNTFTFFDIKADTVKLKGLNFFGSSTNQTGINVNGFKYFGLNQCDFSGLNKGVRFANTSAVFNAGVIYNCNFYNNLIGLFSDTLGEYVSVIGGLFKGNTVAVQNDGGNNKYQSLNVNSNTTGFKFTGGSNNAHGQIIGCSVNHNSTSLDATGCNFGETIDGSHFYEGNMSINNCSNWMFTGGSTISPATLTITNSANIDMINTNQYSTYGTTKVFLGNLNKPKFRDNRGDVAGSITTVNPTYVVLMDSLGGDPFRDLATSDTIDLGRSRWPYKILSANDTIKKLIHPTAGKTYKFEVIGNGFNFVFLDNSKVDGTYNPSATLNLYTIDCIDDGADPRFYVRVSQPGMLVSRTTNNLGWSRVTGAGTISGNNLTKTGPDALSFTVWAKPDKILATNNGYYVAQAASTNANIIWGFSTNATQNSYNSINFAIYFFGSSGGANNINIAESGTLISTGLGGASWATADSFRIFVGTDDSVRYQKFSASTWSTFFTSTHKATYPLIPQVAIRALTTFTNPRIYGIGVTNNYDITPYFAPQYADNINAAQSTSNLTVGTFSNTSTAKGLDITGGAITAHAADSTNAGMVSTTNQKFSGPKTFTDSLRATKLFNKATPLTTDSLLGVNNLGYFFRLPAVAVNVTGENGISYNSSTNAFGLNGAFNQPTVISGASQNVSLGTIFSTISRLEIFADSASIRGGMGFGWLNSSNANLTIGNEGVLYTLIDITANRTITLPTIPLSARLLILSNRNTNAFTWSLATSVLNADGTTLSNLDNGYTYMIMYNPQSGGWVVVGRTSSNRILSGSFSQAGTATTTFTVTIGTTQANSTYKVNVSPTDALAAAAYYVTNKTTTTFDVVYLAGLTGTVSFDWSLFP